MPVKNTVAVERRTDLASLFCMIGRHGPAVALAVIAMVSVVAGFIFYRNVRGKRRKATVGEAAAAAAAAGAEKDASMIGTDEEPEQALSESTDTGDEGSSYTNVDPDLIQSGPRIRHRRSPSAEKPPTFCAPQMEPSVVQDCTRVAEPYEDNIQALLSYLTPATAVGVKDEDDCCPSLAEDTALNVETDCNVESCLEPEPIYDEGHMDDDDEVSQEKCEEDRNMNVDEDVSQGEGIEEENLQCTSDSALCSEQDIPMSETTDNDKLQSLDDAPDTSSHLEKQMVQVQTEEDISDPQTSQVEEVLQCVSSSPVCSEQYLDASDTSDDKPQGSGATLDTQSQSDEPINDAEDCRNIEEGNLCASKNTWCFNKDSVVLTYFKGADSEVAPDVLSSFKEPIIDKEVSNRKISQEEKAQRASLSPVCLDQDVHFVETGEDHKLQIGEIMSGPDNSLEEPLCNANEDEPLSRICEKEVELGENCQADYPDGSKNVVFEEEENKVAVMPECSVDQMFAQQLGAFTSKQENLLCSQQDWCHSTNNVLLSSQEEDRFLTTEVTEEFRGEDNLHNLTEVTPDVGPPEIEHQLQDEHKENNGFAFSQEDGEGDVVGSCGDECEVLNSSVSCLNQSAESVKEDEGNDAKVEASEIVHLPKLMSADQQTQSDEGKDEVTPVLVVVEHNVADEPCLQEEIASEREESGHVVVLAEESGELLPASCYKGLQSDCTENGEMFVDTENHSTDAPVCEASLSSVVSHPELSASSQSDQIQNVSAFSEVSSGVPSDMAECSESQMSLSLSESQLTQSSSGFGGESGISSMAVSPDLSDALDEFGTTPEHVLPSAVDCHPYSEEQAEPQIIFTHGVAVSFNDLVGVAPDSCQTPLQQTSQDWAMDQSVALNEDIFGNDVEDGYHSTMGQLIAANTMNSTDEITKEACNDVPLLLVQIDKKEGAEQKEGAEEFEKTEISIMEATMDNNEWITDGNDQVLPWMNLSTSSFLQTSSKPDPSPDAHSFSLTDDTSLDTDNPPSTEASQTDMLSLEESFDSSKKVLAVQPMPQNVNVTFRIHYLTQSPYQKLALTGNHEELGNWKEFILLDKAKDGHWSTVVGLPAESQMEWKFVVLDKGAVCRWEECGNRLLETGNGEDLIVHKLWGFL